MLGGVGCGVVVPEFGCCGTRQRGRTHYAHERRVVRYVARMDDGIACIGVPLVLVYHVIAYRVFSGRLAEEDVA